MIKAQVSAASGGCEDGNVLLSPGRNAEVSVYSCRCLAVESFQRGNHASYSKSVGPFLPPTRLIRVHRVLSLAILWASPDISYIETDYGR